MKKIFTLIAVCMTAIAANAQATVYGWDENKMTGTDGASMPCTIDYEDGAKLVLNGNVTKDYSSGNTMLMIDGTEVPAIKLSNLAQNTFYAATGKKIYGVTIYSTINKDEATERTCFWAEVNGKDYSNGIGTTSAGKDYKLPSAEAVVHKSFKNGAEPDVISFTFATGVESFTFTNTGEQPLVALVPVYEGTDAPGGDGGAAKADYEIFTETVDEAGVKHYTMPTAMADLQAATGLPVTSWGIGIAVPAGKTILATSEFEVYAPTGHEVNVFDQWGKMGDCPIEGLLNYINVGVNDGTNQWGDDAIILDIEALARQGQTVLEVNAKASGKLGANIIIGENNRSVGIYKVPTEEEMNTDNFGGFVTNIKCDYGAMEKGTAPIPALVADVEAGRQYWIISSRENANLYELTFAAGATGIEGVTSNVEKKIVAVYNLNGVRVNAPVKGLNIVKYSDGSTVKVIK